MVFRSEFTKYSACNTKANVTLYMRSIYSLITIALCFDPKD
jgi:hypothetical protein